MIKATNSRVPSTQATYKTVKCRSQELIHHRQVCSGGEQAYQLSNEVKTCSMEERESLLEELQGGFKVQIPTRIAVAMKADLGIPWHLLRSIRRCDLDVGLEPAKLQEHFLHRWFNACQVSIASEKKMRKRAAEIIGDNLIVEKVALTFSLKEGGEEVKMRPFAYIPNIWPQIVQLLNENER